MLPVPDILRADDFKWATCRRSRRHCRRIPVRLLLRVTVIVASARRAAVTITITLRGCCDLRIREISNKY